ncbi:MAG: GNAT family protein, partial [Bacteroidota bacterium]
HPPATMANFEVFFEGRLVGVAHLDQVDRAAGSARCAVTLGDRAVWGQHLGAEVVQALATYASEELGLRCLVADAQPHNYRWCRLLTRLGFTFQPEPVAGVLQFALELDASVELKTRSGWAVTAAVA